MSASPSSWRVVVLIFILVSVSPGAGVIISLCPLIIMAGGDTDPGHSEVL